MAKNTIEIRNLTFGYLPTSTILDIDGLDIQKGERVFLYGPSGAGKTTLLGLLAGMLTPKSAQLKILDTDFGSLSASQSDRFRGSEIGYIFQMFNLIPYLTVKENILLPCLLNSDRAKRITQSLDEALHVIASHLKIEMLLEKSVMEISVGQQQRVAVARALLGSPGLILADEPTSALDAGAKGQFLDLLFAECERVGSTLLFVSHDHALSTMFQRSVSLVDINRAARKVV